MNFMRAIEAAWQSNDSLVCVGLDPDLSKIPDPLQNQATPLFAFNKAIIDATADLVCAYKPQIAYYAASRAERDLELTIDYIHRNYPQIPVILDAKRGDIGPTAEKYAIEAFDRYQADAITVNPYMGSDTLQPFLARKDKGVVVLCRTSNPGAVDVQDLVCDGQKLYQIIARKAADEWNSNGNVLLVVGATYPQELKEVRKIIGDMALLVPGIGAQGGDIQTALVNGQNNQGRGMIINSSRGILYAGKDKAFAKAARRATMELKEAINRYRQIPPPSPAR